MAYKTKFLHFKTKASYNAERAKTTAGTEERKVFDAYISFIDEGPMICTCGKEYKCDISASEVEALVNAGKISPATVAPLIAGTAAVGTSTKYAREDHRHPEQVNITGNAATATTATNLASAPSFIKNGNFIKITVGNKTSTDFAVPYASKTSAAETLMYGRNIILDGDVTGSTSESFNGSKNVTINTTISTINAEKLTGTIDANRLPEIPVEKIPSALPNPFALTINGISYTGSSAVFINTARILSTATLSNSTVSAGYSYNNTLSRTISSLSGFSSSNPDSVIISTARLTFTASNAIKMDGLADLSGTYYIYCLSYMANGKVAINGAAYA